MSALSRLVLFGLAACSVTGSAWFATAQTPPKRDDLTDGDRARVARVTQLTTDFSKAEKFERMAGGAATSSATVNADAFSHPSKNLAFEDLERFLLGNGLFRKDWVSSPASTQASDGLGPLFNARACQSCHIKDGRGHAPARAEDTAVSMLVRLSVPDETGEKEKPHPLYGWQLQDFAVAGLAPEGRITIEYEALPVELAGGEKVLLRKPSLSIASSSGEKLEETTQLSARIASPMIGLGLLEAVQEADILAWEDPDDTDGDGISGRAARIRNADGEPVLGRFGWKALSEGVRVQTAAAFSGDMGLSTSLKPDHWGDCTEAQKECRTLPHGAQPRLGPVEVPDDLFALVTFYSQNLAVPARRDVGDPDVLAGKQAFYAAGCVSCHRPKFVTGKDFEVEALRFQLIWPYTDLLLHDMGEGLADNRPEGAADGREWRTPPLWGIGLTKTVHAQGGYLHDGRARTLKEAILWHGGEAKEARDRFAAMEKQQRDNLIRFLESL